MKSLLSLHFSIEISTFSLLFVLKPLLSLYFSIEISTFSLLFYWNLYFLFEFYWNLNFLFTCLLKSLLFLYFSIEVSSFSPLYTQRWSLQLLPTLRLRTKMSKQQLCKAFHIALQPTDAPFNNNAHMKIAKKSFAQHYTQPGAATAQRPRRTQRLAPLVFATPCTQIYCENTGIRTLPYFQTCALWHACHTNCNLLTEPPHDWAIQLAELPLDQAIQWWATAWWLYLLTALFNGECSTSWLSYSIVSYLLITLPLNWAI